ncbi:MAG TPA: hypothetical protein VIL21_06820 [Solirubrobacterales bacterium]
MALLGFATPAPAAEELEDRGFEEFTVKASNGYKMTVFAFFQAGYGESSEVAIWLDRKGQAAVYLAPAVVTTTKVEADLGRLGEIDITFHPTGEGVTHPRCEPNYSVEYERGFYTGTIEFHGEEGYTDVSAKRARFSYHPIIDAVACSYTSIGETFGRDLPGARLRAWAKRGAEHLAVRAIQNRPGARVRMEAAIEERRGRIRISREIERAYPASAFHFAPDLRSAALAPSAPFAGTGLFHRNAKPTNRWTGNLSVDFPGRSNVSLTGDRFHVSLQHARLTKETFYPERRSRPSLLSTDYASLQLPKPR